MSNVNELKETLKSIVTSLHRTVECPVCLEPVKIPVKLCVKGHGVCSECTTRLEKCPLCKGPFILENLVFVNNVIEALPQFCRYSDKGCEEVVVGGSDHERFCGYRPFVCPKDDCSNVMPIMELKDHIEVEDYFCCFYEEKEEIKWEHGYGCTPVFLFDNIFWLLEFYDTKEKQYKMYFLATPLRKLDHSYYLRFTHKEGDFCLSYTLKASVSSPFETRLTVEEEIQLLEGEDFIKIPQSMLPNFTKEDGSLWAEFYFFRR